MAESSNLLRSRLPGRIRLRHPALRACDRLEALVAELGDWEGMISVEGNPATGGLLLHYDPARRDPAEMEARVIAAASAAIGIAPASPPASEAPRLAAISRRIASRATVRQLNRGAKIGMMASLPLSLAALAFSKRTHTAAGIIFVAATLVHMAANRRHLLT